MFGAMTIALMITVHLGCHPELISNYDLLKYLGKMEGRLGCSGCNPHPGEGETSEGEGETGEGETGEGETGEGETGEGEEVSGPLLYVGLTVHLEGHNVFTRESHERYRDAIMNYAGILEEHGAKATWEVKEPIDSCVLFDDPYFALLEQSGHGVGVHADLGSDYPPGYSYDHFVTDLAARKEKLELQDVTVRHVSGYCSDLDWSNAVADGGYEFVTGVIGYCVACLDASIRPPGYEDCTSPIECHNPFPDALQERIRPWRADRNNWTQPNDDGRIVIIPEGCHGLAYLAENSTENNCPDKAAAFTQEDVDIYFDILDEALSYASPDHVNTFYVVWSFGMALDPTLFAQWLTRLEAYVESGQVAWKTVSEMYDLFVAEEPVAQEETPVFVTIAGHIEENLYYTNCTDYLGYRDKLLQFIQLMDDHSVPFDLQIDYPFFVGAADCETPAMQMETGNTNTLDYISTHFDVRIDPHKSGGWEEDVRENYADVRYIGGQTAPNITDNVGGIVWDNVAQYERFSNGAPGLRHPEFIWFPEILTLGVHTNHHLGDFSRDDRTSGIWKPRGFGPDFLVHDPAAPLVYVGPGTQHTDWFGRGEWEFATVADYVQVLVDYIASGKLPKGKMYTATIAIPQQIIFNAPLHHKLTDQFDQLAPLVNQGKVVYAHYSDVVEQWVRDYDEESNLLPFDAIDPVDYTVTK